MNERVVEIINYIINEIQSSESNLQKLDQLSAELTHQGYSEDEISSAFSWLFDKIKINIDDLISPPKNTLPHAFRVLHDVERLIISPRAYGYLIQLRELGLISAMELEQIIEKALMIGTSTVSLEDVKAIVASLIFNSEGLLEGTNYIFDNLYQVH
ncbi:DUF494 family protein [candidate division KSB1 bacterium]|nr:DUF494 family protein [candidate division KSB1 bacterium]